MSTSMSTRSATMLPLIQSQSATGCITSSTGSFLLALIVCTGHTRNLSSCFSCFRSCLLSVSIFLGFLLYVWLRLVSASLYSRLLLDVRAALVAKLPMGDFKIPRSLEGPLQNIGAGYRSPDDPLCPVQHGAGLQNAPIQS